MGVNNLPRVATRQCAGRESNLQSLDHEFNALPLHYRATQLCHSVVIECTVNCSIRLGSYFVFKENCVEFDLFGSESEKTERGNRG